MADSGTKGGFSHAAEELFRKGNLSAADELLSRVRSRRAGPGLQTPGQEGVAASPHDVKVVIAPDGMSASITLAPSTEPYTEEEVRSALSAAGGAHGIDAEDLDAEIRRGGSGEPVEVARGTRATPGVDATVEYLFPSGSGELKERAGRVDWRELNLIHSVQVGAPLARRKPAQAGTPGMTVRGRPIPARPPKTSRVSLGPGAAASDSDPNLIVASVGGAVRLDASGRLTVDNSYSISGDVDLTTGNIDFMGSLVIQGDVKKGFTVVSTGDVQVKGVIEEASIIAGGSVMVQGGILGGSGSTSIQAGRDVLARFANNAVLIAGNDVTLGQEAVNCHIEAEGSVTVRSAAGGAIRGGNVKAGGAIHVDAVGVAGGARTKLRAGYDWLLPRKLKSAEDELGDRAAQLEHAQTTLQSLLRRRADGPLTESQQTRLDKLLLAVETLRAAVRALEAHRASLRVLGESKGVIVVHGVARAGTEMIVDGKMKILSEDREAERFIAEESTVVGIPIAPAVAREEDEFSTLPVLRT